MADGKAVAAPYDLGPWLSGLPDADPDARRGAEARVRDLLRPAAAFARLDQIAVWLAGWQRGIPRVSSPAALIFAGDHGVTADGVSLHPPAVTAAIAAAVEGGVATASAVARSVGVRLMLVDVGIGRPTGNIAREDALDPARFAECVEAGQRAVNEADADLLVLGEAGIGNTTVAAAVCASLFGGDVASWVGRGAGATDASLQRKRAAVVAACGRVPELASSVDVLRIVGGAELAAIAGAIVEARRRSIPVVLDGFVVTASAATLERARAGALEHCLAGHVSAEAGHRRALRELGLTPILDLGLALGEGTGGLLAVPLLRAAAAAVADVATFTEMGLAR